MGNLQVGFKRIPGHPGYSINKKGEIYSHKTNRMMVIRPNPRGYLQARLSDGKGKRKTPELHRLLAITFKPNPDPSRYDCLDHIDGDKLNNDLDNLRWTTRSKNTAKSFKDLGLKRKRHTGYTGQHYKDLESLVLILSVLKGLSSRQVAQRLPLDHTLVLNILKSTSTTTRFHRFKRPVTRKEVLTMCALRSQYRVTYKEMEKRVERASSFIRAVLYGKKHTDKLLGIDEIIGYSLSEEETEGLIRKSQEDIVSSAMKIAAARSRSAAGRS